MTTNIVTDTNAIAKSNDDDLIMCNYLVEQMKLEKNRDALRKCHFEFNIISKSFLLKKMNISLYMVNSVKKR